MLNLETKKVILTRTLDWNDESYGQTKRLKDEEISKLETQLEKIEENESYEMLDIGTDMTEDQRTQQQKGGAGIRTTNQKTSSWRI